MRGYVKNFKDKSNKLMSLYIDDDKLLEKHKPIWTTIGDLKNIKLNALRSYDNGYIKTKMRTFIINYKVYNNFCGLNVP